jgi:O-acetyl-ADP-ribose deacetylase (regulator of RNase III)
VSKTTSNQEDPNVLEFNAYRTLVHLDTPHHAPKAINATERDAIVARMVAHLLTEDVPSRVRRVVQRLGEGPDAMRRALTALLTGRHPHGLPDDFLDDVEAVLGFEAASRPVVQPATLPVVATTIPGTGYPVASRTALWQGDITCLAADAIVNAANDALLGCFAPFHRCIDNAIHVASGPRLRDDCARIMEAQGHAEPVGTAKATRAYALPSRFVLHTVGPQVRTALHDGHAADLASCYWSCLDVAARLPDVRTVAFCGISTGEYGYPKREAARVAIVTVAAWLADRPDAFDLVIFNVFGDDDHEAYLRAFEDY